MNTYDETTGLFHEGDIREFAVAMVDDQPEAERYQIVGADPESGWSEPEFLHWLQQFLGNKDEGQFRHIIERIKMDRRQNEGAED